MEPVRIPEPVRRALTRTAILAIGMVMPGALCAQTTNGPATLSGLVLTDSTERPIGGAEIVLQSMRNRVALTTRSDSSGSFLFRGLPVGRHRLTVRAVGYQALTVDLDVPAAGLQGMDFLMQPVATKLERVDVRAAPVPRHLQDFESRRKVGIGHFMDSTQLWIHGDPSQWSQRLVEQTPNLRAVGYGGSKALITTRGLGSFTGLPGGDGADAQRGARPACYVRVIVDGVIRYNSTVGESLFDVTNWAGPPIVAAEFYTPAQLPVEFNRLGSVSCGALVLWTRR